MSPWGCCSASHDYLHSKPSEDDAQIRGVPVGSPVGRTSPGPSHGKRGSNKTCESSNDTNFSFYDGDSRTHLKREASKMLSQGRKQKRFHQDPDYQVPTSSSNRHPFFDNDMGPQQDSFNIQFGHGMDHQFGGGQFEAHTIPMIPLASPKKFRQERPDNETLACYVELDSADTQAGSQQMETCVSMCILIQGMNSPGTPTDYADSGNEGETIQPFITPPMVTHRKGLEWKVKDQQYSGKEKEEAAEEHSYQISPLLLLSSHLLLYFNGSQQTKDRRLMTGFGFVGYWAGREVFTRLEGMEAMAKVYDAELAGLALGAAKAISYAEQHKEIKNLHLFADNSSAITTIYDQKPIPMMRRGRLWPNGKPNGSRSQLEEDLPS
ncbi:hypothetical protein BT96DRAFT_946996 [Gymnopus androsaceus JB14]|uniref:Uncharacterized protein n=1 Tax=Gymnopus androsaceus JB14 TaxID=1447944 RepID=A0A6A4GU84_9AGAR|nr:hypothetical protein BT96DRAFT_946996 [Gymnopus androsaceus JB14]